MRVIDNEYMEPEVLDPKVTGAPDAIWLVYGDLDENATHDDCYGSGEVTWCQDAQFPADVRYVRADVAEAEILTLRIESDTMRALLVEWDDGMYDSRDFLRRVRLVLHGGGGLQVVPVGPNA